MDVVRKRSKSRKWLSRLVLVVFIGGGITGITIWLQGLQAARLEVDRDKIIIDTVKRGLLVREVGGDGTLVPRDITWVTTEVSGRVAKVLVEPGTAVVPETIIMELHDPQMERAVREAKRQVDTAVAALNQFKLTTDTEHLRLQSATNAARFKYEDSLTDAELDATLARSGLIPRRQAQASRDRAIRNRQQFVNQVAQVKNSLDVQRIQLKEREVAVESATDRYDEHKEREKALTVRAGVAGILQQFGAIPGETLQVGQRIAEGAYVAMITDPTRLKAELQLPQTLATDVVVGQRVNVDTRDGIIPGRVSLISPAVQQERVGIEVQLKGELPKVARPDLSVHGTVEVDRLEDVFHMRKPVYGREGGTLSVFVLSGDGKTAIRRTVQFGRSSLHEIQVEAGLEEGDQVIVSDTSRWKDHDEIGLR